MLDSPQVEFHEVFVLLQILTSSWVQFAHNILNLGNLVRPLIVWMKYSQDGGIPFSVIMTSSSSSIGCLLNLRLSLSSVILMKYEEIDSDLVIFMLDSWFLNVSHIDAIVLK